MIYDKLQKIGLTEKEAKIYVSLLELGETNIQRVSKKSKIKRTTIYNIIETLKEKGLISTIIKKKRRYYAASDPRDLELKLDEQKSVLKNILPELLSITNLIDKKPKIRFFDGIEGIKELCLDTLKCHEKPMFNWLTNDMFTDYFDKEFVEYYISKRVENKTMLFVIAPDTPQIRSFKSADLKSLRQTRIDPESPKIEVEIEVYGDDKTAIISYGEGFGLIIESKKIYNTLKGIFDVSWKNLGHDYQ